MLLFFQEPSQFPIVLGPLGTLIGLFFLVLLGILNVIQFRQRETTQRLKGEIEKYRTAAEAGTTTVEFAQSELNLVRERCGRLETTNETLTQENATLRSRTDLDALSKRLESADSRAGEAHAAILHGLENLAAAVVKMSESISEMSKRDAERDAQYASLIASQSELIKSLQSQVNFREALRKAS